MIGQHTDYTMLMSLVLDDEATAAEAARLREHLVECDICARTWQRWQELDRRFTLAPLQPAPIDFAAAVAVRLDQRMAEQARRRWFMLGLALSCLVAMLFTVLAFGLASGWHWQLLSDGGPWSAAWTGIASIGGWMYRILAEFVTRLGTPTVAAGAGALLCLVCGLATVWLWMVARLSPPASGRLVSAE